MHSSFSIRHFSPTLVAVLCRSAPELARTKRPTPPDVVATHLGLVLTAVAAQPVGSVGELVVAVTALGFEVEPAARAQPVVAIGELVAVVAAGRP